MNSPLRFLPLSIHVDNEAVMISSKGKQSSGNRRLHQREDKIMKGYNTEAGYVGYVNGTYILFASEADYREYMEEDAA